MLVLYATLTIVCAGSCTRGDEKSNAITVGSPLMHALSTALKNLPAFAPVQRTLSADGLNGMLNVCVRVASSGPTRVPVGETAYTFIVIGTENVEPGVVAQLCVDQPPV